MDYSIECNLCKKKFNRIQNLKRHKLICKEKSNSQSSNKDDDLSDIDILDGLDDDNKKLLNASFFYLNNIMNLLQRDSLPNHVDINELQKMITYSLQLMSGIHKMLGDNVIDPDKRGYIRNKYGNLQSIFKNIQLLQKITNDINKSFYKKPIRNMDDRLKYLFEIDKYIRIVGNIECKKELMIDMKMQLIKSLIKFYDKIEAFEPKKNSSSSKSESNE